MTKSTKTPKLIKATQLSLSEQHEINQKIEFETSKMFHDLVKLGAFANIIGALFYILAIYNPAQKTLIFTWYSILVVVNILNILWSLRFEHEDVTHAKIREFRQGYFYIVSFICLLWGCIGILFMSEATQSMTTIIFLSAVLICFSFSTAVDLTMGLVSILCLLAPAILYHLYLTIPSAPTIEGASHLNMPIIAAFVTLGLFMLIACFIGNKVIIKVFRLGYENKLLCQKFENINTLLEQRVKERTEALETSLKLVTYQATHDLLTELPNERLLYEHITAATERAMKNHYKFAVACFSLNGMVKINDSIGHQAATTIINRASQRLSHLLQQKKNYFISLSRQDVFVILIEPISDVFEIENYVQNLFVILNNPIYVAKQSIKLSGSIGVSVFPDNGRDVDTLITNAEAARVLATQRGGNSVCIYNIVINADAARQLRIENMLYQAVEKNELILNYQPFIDLRTGRICGAEALVRWQNPVLGLVAPMDFIPIAEMNGMILPIGEWVLRAACQQLKKWHNSGFNTFKMSVNLSAKQLVQEDLVDCIAEILDTIKLSPQYLELELTESNVFNNEAIPIINKLAEMGIAFAIDDFGTGYSEFSNLKLFKVDKIKIDKIFIQDLNVNIDSRNIVCNTIALANRMHIDCLAEGVETEEQTQFLKENGCYIMQGYYFSKPLSAEDFFVFLKKYENKNVIT